MAIKFTLQELKLADELAFPEDIERLYQKYFPEDWRWMSYDFIHRYNRNILSQFMAYTRDSNIWEGFSKVVYDLITPPADEKGENQ